MDKNKGIILKNHSHYKHTLSIFDQTFGKIEGYVQQSRYHNHGSPPRGSIIRYHAQTRGQSYLVTNVELCYVPFELAKQDIHFFQHILELCYYCLPLHAPAHETFSLIELLFKSTNYNKFLMLFRFFTTLSMHPEESIIGKNHLHRFISAPLETIVREKLDEYELKMVQSWLSRCIEINPYKKFFKIKYIINS